MTARLAIAVTAVAMTASGACAANPGAPPRSAAGGRDVDPAAKKYAFVVGVNTYQHPNLRPLKYAENDAVKLGELLEKNGYAVTLLTGSGPADRKPTRKGIEDRLEQVLTGCQKADTVLVAFAGHGLQFDGDRDSYFCPSDAVPLKSGANTLVSMKRVYDSLGKSFAGVKVLLVDACRDDPQASRGVTESGPKPAKGIAVLFSCNPGERAYEHDSLKHGVFFYYVLRGLAGLATDSDGDVTFDYL